MVSRADGHTGTTDWLVQRVSAVILAIYTLGLAAWFVCVPTVDYALWHALNAGLFMRLANTVMLLALVAHAWVGIWTIITDYVTPTRLQGFGRYATVLGTACEVLTVLWLLGCLIWGAVIIWTGV